MGTDSHFADRVRHLVSHIPEGRVMTYGQIAAIAGNARAARVVGGIAHFGERELPWQRVVNRHGRLASGYPGGRVAHKQQLEADGVKVLSKEGEYYVDIDKLLWQPLNEK